MTVDDLREELAKLDGKKQVVVYWEDEESQTHFFGIDEVISGARNAQETRPG